MGCGNYDNGKLNMLFNDVALSLTSEKFFTTEAAVSLESAIPRAASKAVNSEFRKFFKICIKQRT